MSLIMLLRVGSSSAQDISLTEEPGGVRAYHMGTPDLDQETLRNLGDGDSLSVPAWRNVTESIDLRIGGPGWTPQQVRDKVQAIERLLDLARQGTTGYLDDKLYLLILFDHDTEDWRSQILAARWLSDTATDQIWRSYVDGTIVLTRRYYWETKDIATVAITSGVTTTPTTGMAVVYNADDTHASNRNWWQCAADQVIGSIPAPATITVRNDSGGDRYMGSLYLGNYVYNAPTTVDPIFRDDQQSGGTSTIFTVETMAARWLISSNNLTNSFRGQFGRVLAVWSDRPAPTTLLRAGLQLRMAANIDIVMGEQALPPGSDHVMDLGGIPIPPGGYYDGIGSFLHLVIKARAFGSNDTMAVNWVLVMPSGAGRFRHLQGIETLTLSDGEAVVDDGCDGGAYILSGSAKMPLLRPFFQPIHLWPGRVNRMRLLISGGTLGMEPDQPWGVTMQYRPRRLTL